MPQENPNKDKSWTKGPKISLEDCKKGTGYVEKISADEALLKSKPKAKTEVKKPHVKIFKFGKYKGRLYSEIEIENPGYMHWCRENISNFDG